MKTLDIPGIFKSEAVDILKCRSDAIRIHGTNIRAAGNEVEVCVREFLKRMLPPRYYVTQGHLIDRNGNVSSQSDVIISDNFNIPSLQTTKDGTEYIPIDSVYALGEIKSTYYKSKNPIQSFSKSIKDIRKDLHHEEIINTAYGGIKGDTLIRDAILARGNRVLNRILYFSIFIDGGDFEFEEIAPFYAKHEIKYLPDIVVILNKGIIIRASFIDEKFSINRYPEEPKNDQEDWYFSPLFAEEGGSIEGNHLGFLYYSLVEHLANSLLEPPSLIGYLHNLMIGRKSLLKRASAT